MKRVGNKPGQLVRSASRRKKTASRFQFDITINAVSGLKSGGKYLVKWSRGVKVAQTKQFVTDKEATTKAGQAIDQKLSLLVTLYREDGKKFDQKEAKLSLINISSRGGERTVAKTRFDLSSFAGVPSASSNKTLALSDKVSIHSTIDSRFLKTGAGGPGSTGGSSALSGMSGVSGRSSEEEDDDFDDLVIDDVPEPAPAAPTRSKPPPSAAPAPPSRAPVAAPLKATTPTRQSVAVHRAPSDPSHGSSAAAAASSAPRMPATANGQRAPASPSARHSDSPSARGRRERSASALTDESSSSRTSRAEDEQRVARLSRDNMRLSAELEEMRRQQHAQQNGSAASTSEIARLSETLEQRTREKADASAALQSTNRSVDKLRQRVSELEEQTRESERSIATLRTERDDLQARARRLDTSERKCAELSREVDRLTVAAATAAQGDSQEDGEKFAVVEARIATLQAEKEQLERKLKSHQDHGAEVKATYEKLSAMYGTLREEHTALQREAEIAKRTAKQQQEQLAAASSSRSADDSISTARLTAELEQARDEVRALESGRAGAERESERLGAELRSLREQLEAANDATEDARREADDLAAEVEEMKGQRDMAMQRALSKGKSSSSSDSSKGRLSNKAEDVAREEQQRELERLSRKVGELETQNGELREDLEYEKSEKSKARDERDKMRETARALERRTSQAAKAADALNSVRRELSTQQMRTQDHESMISHMKGENERLQTALDEAERRADERGGGGADDGADEMLTQLVEAKLSLAEAQGDKQQLEFAMKKMRKQEKAIQQRLAQHASRLEVKLGEATEELERVKKQRRSENRNEFNELGSDVDY